MSTGMLNDALQSVLQVQSRDDFRHEVIRFAQNLGFDYVSAMTVVDQSVNNSEFIGVDNMPERMVETVAQLDKACRRDPVMQHCKRAALPIVWNQGTYVKHGASDLWEEQAAFGYQNGIALAMHFPEGRHFLMGVDRASNLPGDSHELTRIVADLQLFAVHAQDAAMRLFVPPTHQLERPNLTPREVESLQWTMEGKTAWEVGAILGISERTAVLHLQNAMRKLEAINKHQAVLKALRLGLIQ
jgi:DNA-binding CsgD family transcriptional regulator